MPRLINSVEGATDDRYAERPDHQGAEGTEISCKGWHQEAALRMLMNNLDPEVAERPENLVVYGGTGKQHDWESFWASVHVARSRLRRDPRAVGQARRGLRTHAWSPRVLIANSLLVPDWADRDTFRELGRPGLAMYGHDRGVLDLHRHPGHLAGDFRDVRRRRRTALRRHPAGTRLPRPQASGAWAAPSRSP